MPSDFLFDPEITISHREIEFIDCLRCSELLYAFIIAQIKWLRKVLNLTFEIQWIVSHSVGLLDLLLFNPFGERDYEEFVLELRTLRLEPI